MLGKEGILVMQVSWVREVIVVMEVIMNDAGKLGKGAKLVTFA